MHRQPGPTISLFSFQDIITSVMGILLFIALLLALKLATAVAALGEPVSGVDGLPDPTALPAEIEELRKERERLTQDVQRSKQMVKEVTVISEEELRSLRNIVAQLEAQRSELETEVAQLQQEYDRTMREGQDQQTALEQQLQQLDSELAQVEEELQKVSGTKQLAFNFQGLEDYERFILDLGRPFWRVKELGPDGKIKSVFDFTGNVPSRQRQFQEWLAKRSSSRTYIFLIIRPSMQDVGHSILEMLREKGFPRGFEPLGEDQDFILDGTGS